jgi:hypothetical protein
VLPPANLAALAFFNQMQAPRQSVQNACQDKARLVLVAAADVICVQLVGSPTSLVRLTALPVRKEKSNLPRINRDVLHVMQGSIKTLKLNNPVCGTCPINVSLHPRSLSNVFFRVCAFSLFPQVRSWAVSTRP